MNLAISISLTIYAVTTLIIILVNYIGELESKDVTVPVYNRIQGGFLMKMSRKRRILIVFFWPVVWIFFPLRGLVNGIILIFK